MRAHGPDGLGEFHLDFSRTANVAHTDLHLHGEVRRVLHAHALKVGQQRAELIGIGEEVEDLFRTARSGELARKLDGQP